MAGLTAFFARADIARLDGVQVIAGGWLNQHWIQLAYQLADSVAGGTYSFVGTCIILFILNLIPGLQLRADEDAEILGIDDAEIGEFAFSAITVALAVGAVAERGRMLPCIVFMFVWATVRPDCLLDLEPPWLV